MVRASASTPSKSKRKEKDGGAAVSAEDKAEEADSKRLRDLAFSRSLLSRSRSHALQPSLPSKTILNSDGRDIVKKGHRKSKYLFAFPGLMGPVAGGKLGELSNLDSKNPVLYVEFPQGRLKLFGTIVYPKNKYLTLHFPRGSGNIICEDCFESLIVFSQAWWIGTKEHNPEEARLPMPRSLEQDKHVDVDFTAGAGQAKDYDNKTGDRPEKFGTITQSVVKPKLDVSDAENSDKDTEDQIMSQPVRQSARTAGRTLKYADSSSDKEDNSDSLESQQISNSRAKKYLQTPKELSNEEDKNKGATSTVIVVSDSDTPVKIAGTGIYGKESPSDVKVETTTVKSVTTASKLSLKASNSKTSVLKQSLLNAFCLQDPTPTVVHTTAVKSEPIMDTQHEVTTSGIKTAKRPRKASKEDSEASLLDDYDDSSGIKDTPSKDQKRVKREKGAGSKASTPTTTPSKASNGSRPKQVKSSQEKKSAVANASKGVGSASKGRKPASKSTNLSKKSSDTEEEMSEPDDVSDDSDEDWIG